MVSDYPLLFALVVFACALATAALAGQALATRRAMARAWLAHRLGRVPRGPRATRVIDDAANGPVGRPLHRLLMRAGEPMTVNALLTRMVGFAGLGALCLGLGPRPLLSVVGLAAGALPVLSVHRQGQRRSERIVAQLPEAFDLIARALRGGHAFSDAMQLAGKELPAPLGQELALAAERHRLGLDLRTCLLELADRQAGNFDLQLFVSMVLLHQQTGGNLIDTLNHLAETLRERAMAREKLQAVTAEVRMSAAIVGVLPFFVGAMLLWVRPGYLLPLVYVPLGQKLAAVAISSLVIGFSAMRRLVQVEA